MLAARRGEPLPISAMSLLEIADLASGINPHLGILPVTCEVARDVAYLAVLRDPADRAIVATARVHKFRLVTSDQRIIESKLVPVVD